VTAENSSTTHSRSDNPYIGPREFKRGETLPNRKRQARELRDLVIAERVVLLHAPSGAGKTSLIEAAVVDKLFKEGFAPTPRLRVNLPVPDESQRSIHNRYTFSIASYLLNEHNGCADYETMTLSQIVDKWTERTQPQGLPVLIIDQLEEALNIDPTDWPGQEVFFRELGQVVVEQRAWLLLAMREDYIGGLHRFMRLPGLAHARYRLDYLSFDDARRAVQVPAQERNVTIPDDAAIALLDRLAIVKVQRPDTLIVESKRAPYIQPFQLQVTCHQLWEETRRDRSDSIDIDHVRRHADVDQALTRYYGDTVHDVAKSAGAEEDAIRDWFETRLITKQHYRSQTQEPPVDRDAGTGAKVLSLLESSYLIESGERAGAIWYELTHDRLINPVLDSNAAWRSDTLESWQVAARKWDTRGRGEAYLLSPRDLQSLPIWRSSFTAVEADFVTASHAKAARFRRIERALTNFTRLKVAVIAEAILIMVLLIFLAGVVLR
jgi:hypothetical protein